MTSSTVTTLTADERAVMHHISFTLVTTFETSAPYRSLEARGLIREGLTFWETTEAGRAALDAGTDRELRDSVIARTVRLTQGHLDRGQLPVPPVIREQLAPGQTITVTLHVNPGFRQEGAWHTEQLRATLAGITWPAEITAGTRACVSVQWCDGRARRVAVVIDAPAPAPARRRTRTARRSG
ncbi:hypothetical protein [Saccharothrix xinjiangensis]|uniref:Uncharacterized protein n=1 Tax=Saccharothrix xinjiangensis TaxID=204798 RepID=A0ABV9XWI1_9PSEU